MNRQRKKNATCAKTQQTAFRGGSFRITQKADYALFLLTTLAKAKSTQSVRALAKTHDMSFAFLQKVALLLRHKQLIFASRGKQGGYYLARQPSRIFFRDVLAAVEGRVVASGCIEQNGMARTRCPRSGLCTIRPALQKIHSEMQNLYLSKPLTYFMNRV